MGAIHRRVTRLRTFALLALAVLAGSVATATPVHAAGGKQAVPAPWRRPGARQLEVAPGTVTGHRDGTIVDQNALYRASMGSYRIDQAARREPRPARVATPSDLTAALGPELASRVPAGTRIVKLRASRFVEEPGEITFAPQQVSGPPQHDLSQDALARAGGAIRPGRPVKTVLMPLGGYDAATPSLLFRDAETVMVVDSQPMLRRDLLAKKIPFARLRAQNYGFIDTIEAMPHLLSATIGSLAWANPKYRLRGVTHLEVPREAGKVHNAYRTGDVTVIEHDSGEGTPVRRHIHVSDDYPREPITVAGVTSGATTKPWWWQALEAQPPDAVVLKGTQSVFKYDPRARNAVRGLLRGGGTLVEATNEGRAPGVSAASAARADGMKLRRAPDEGEVPELPFGYGHLLWSTY